MKGTMLNFLLFIIFINNLSFGSCSSSQNSNFLKQLNKVVPENQLEKQKLIQCKLCEGMFDYNFNYEEILKTDKIDTLKKAFDSIRERGDLNGFFSKDNMEFITKEISMQYFFKGADSLINEVSALKFKECKSKKIGKEEENCEKIKLGICEKVLNYENGVCINVKSHMKDLMMNISLRNKNLNNEFDLEEQTKFNTKEQNSEYIPENPENIINFKKFHFKEREGSESHLKNGKYDHDHSDVNNHDKDKYKDGDTIQQYGDMSLIELSPETIKNNYDSVPKSHWTPPKPVLLQNFERNIGDQLKDISGLAT